MTKIWERYFIKETIKIFVLIVVCFYGLYVFIDYASHANGKHYHHSSFQWGELIQHYSYEFVLRFDVIIPFALMIAYIRTLCQLNANNELIALMASGIKRKRLLLPFISLGLLFTGLTYLNTEYLLPKALSKLRHTHDVHTLIKSKKKHNIFVQHLMLKDGSSLLYQNYDSTNRQFFDVYWIKSFDEIYRVKYLDFSSLIPVGRYVDYLARNKQGQLVKMESNKTKTLSDLKFNDENLLDTLTPPEELSISTLWKKQPRHQGPPSEKESTISVTFDRKLALPWFNLFAIIAPAPFCLRFTRRLPLFFIYAFSIFGLVASYLILDSAVVLGGRQVIPARWAIGLPFATLMGFFLWRFARIR